MNTHIRIGIVGGTGYTGAELVRILSQHPNAKLQTITSRKEAGTPIWHLYPQLRGISDLHFSTPEEADLHACDVVFFATPHGVCMEQAPALLAQGIKVIDLSADFRLKDPKRFEAWYHIPHTAQDWLEKAVYGIPEIHRDALKTAQLVACAGCYPTSVQLGFKPLLEQGLIELDTLVADVKSGVSGAGREAKVANLYSEINDSFKAYGITGHRHLPEIQEKLSALAGETVRLVFVPHLVPMTRGIEATLYARLKRFDVDLQALYQSAFAHEPFVDVLPAGFLPETRSVRGSNQVRMSVHRAPESDYVVVSVVEDNLVKGASGQAVQCMNLMFGLEETTGLNLSAL
ncbi:MAG: N-acetyl-gamma-glutamyl-phosphate reductase [Cardiobacteriaceae bacterium]|nr:N-acetyl-gamma-glutamyl-phosphate reductase [Cardiobacteriaceae bacterium]